MNWILVIFIHAGIWSHNDDATMYAIPGFVSKAGCEDATKELKKLVSGSKQDLTWVCIPQEKPR